MSKPNGSLKRIHTYELTYAAVAAAAASSSPAQFQVEADYDFFWIKSSAFVYDAAGLGVSRLQWPNLEVVMQDGKSAQQLSNQAASIGALFGSGEIPFILPKPHRIPGGATFSATVTNRHTTTAYSVRLCFTGIHVYREQGVD